MKFIHIADIHLGAVPDAAFSWGKEREKEIWSSFNRIIDICNEEQADLLLIAGDLFHKQPLLRQLKEVNYAFGKLIKTKVFLMAGNHDYLSPASHYHAFAWDSKVHMFYQDRLETVHIPELNTYLYGLSYKKRDITEPLYDTARPQDEPGYHILLAHGGDEKDIPINRKSLLDAGFDYIALGHIHKPELMDDRMAYAGSLEPLDKNETGAHGYILGELQRDSQGRRATSIRFVPFCARQYKRITLTVDRETSNGALLDLAKSIIQREGSEHIYSFLISGFRDEDLQFDKEALKSLGNVMEVEDQSVPDYDLERLYKENADNILGLFIKRMDKSLDREQQRGEAAFDKTWSRKEETAIKVPEGSGEIEEKESKKEAEGTLNRRRKESEREEKRPLSREQLVAEKALYYGLKALLDTK